MWDIFISHASEDKDTLVRPLAKLLSEVYKLNVWYDEFTLEYRDSLLDSIEHGLQNSVFGIVIFSKDFFEKVWTDHEFKSLRTKEMLLNKKVIIPVWYDITKEEIAKHSLALADKMAISLKDNFDIDEIAVKIIKTVRPDIYNNITRMRNYEQLVKSSLSAYISLEDMKKNPVPPIRHKELSIPMKARLKLIYNAITDVDKRGYEEYERDFRRSTNIDRELVITELITAAYVECIEKKELTLKEKGYVYILSLSLGEINNVNFPIKQNDLNEFISIIKSYLQDIDAHVTMEFRFKDK